MSMGRDYSDMWELPHPDSRTHPRMSLYERAAQFSPFAALTGYEDVIEESGRRTSDRVEQTEERMEELDRVLQQWTRDPDMQMRIVYFAADAKKDGGAYLEIQGQIRDIDHTARLLRMRTGMQIPLADIYEMEPIVLY